MRGRTNVGGGDNLNFKIVGSTTQPSNPKENTIWIETGYIIHAWDFSATEPLRRSKNKNFVVYPFEENTKTSNGVTWTNNGDGTLTANGTSGESSSSIFMCNSRNGNAYTLALPAGTYHLSGAGGGVQIQAGVSYDKGATVARYITDTGNGNTFTITSEAYVSIAAFVPKNTSVSNAVAKPQLEKGSAATSFIKGDAAGQVWIETGAGSLTPFNALKKNGIMVYPVNAKLYQQGAWKKKPARTYQNGAWAEWWTGQLYINGTDYTEVTGGWSVGGYPPSGWSSSQVKSVTLHKNATNMSFGGGLNNIWPGKIIDLTNFTKLVWKGSASGYSLIHVTNKKESSFDSSDVASADISGKTTASIDISKVTGNYYIVFVTMNTDSTITIQELYME
jgi:hypothetical protein